MGCCAPLAAKKAGVALRAGLEAALKPRERVFPLTGYHPWREAARVLEHPAAESIGNPRIRVGPEP